MLISRVVRVSGREKSRRTQSMVKEDDLAFALILWVRPNEDVARLKQK